MVSVPVSATFYDRAISAPQLGMLLNEVTITLRPGRHPEVKVKGRIQNRDGRIGLASKIRTVPHINLLPPIVHRMIETTERLADQ